MDRFDAMLGFTRVVELASFTKASSSLNIPKTTLSAQVHALEQHLRVKLLHRTTRNISVTADGAAYYERAVRLLAELEETEAAVTRLTTTPRGPLRVNVPGSLGRRVIVPALGDFLRLYPEIELDVGCTDRPIDLLQEGVDCVIRGGPAVDDSLVVRRLGSVRMMTCAAPAYLERAGTPLTLEELAHHDMVHYVSPKSGRAYGFEYLNHGERVSIFGKRRITINDTDACVTAALGGIGLVQLPEFIVKGYLATGELRALLGAQPTEETPICIYYPQNRHLSTKVRVFVDWAVELFAESATPVLASRTRTSGIGK